MGEQTKEVAKFVNAAILALNSLSGDKTKFIFKGRTKKTEHKILSVCLFGPCPSLPKVQCASALHINQMGVTAQLYRSIFSPFF